MPLLILLLVGLVLEVLAIIAVADLVGAAVTVLLLLAGSILGGWLIRRTGPQTWRQATAEVQAGRSPADAVVDGAVRVLAGALLLVPGLVSSAVGLVLLSPLGRLVRRPLRASLGRVRAPTIVGTWPGGGASPFGQSGAGPWGPGDPGDVVEGTATEWPGGPARPPERELDPPGDGDA
ncbi:MAG: FxsA family protein [Solirubrobacteraceae bacterium]